MPQPLPYLALDGTCRQAMTFHAEALGGRLDVLMTNGESPIACHSRCRSAASTASR